MNSDIRIQIDGAYNSTSGMAAIGMIFYDCQGTSILTKGRQVYSGSALQAEGLARLHAIRMAAELGFTNIHSYRVQTTYPRDKEYLKCSLLFKTMVEDITYVSNFFYQLYVVQSSKDRGTASSSASCLG